MKLAMILRVEIYQLSVLGSPVVYQVSNYRDLLLFVVGQLIVRLPLTQKAFQFQIG